MSYAHTTLSDLRTQLSARLQDPSNQFWSAIELNSYINESLRTFGALTSFWRERATFPTVSGTTFYSLPSQITSLSYSVTDRTLLEQVAYHLMESTINMWTGWVPTDQFTMTDLTKALQHRRNQFLADTGMHISRTAAHPVPAPPINRVSLTDTVIDVRRVVWNDVDGTHTHLWRDDAWALNAYDLDWTLTVATPSAFSVLVPPPLTLVLYPPPANNGTLELLTVDSGADLAPLTAATVLGIPDDWCWVVKWGVLADLLKKEGPAKDLSRAAWCEQRYTQGVAIAKEATCILQAQINGVNTFVSSLAELDALYTNWQNTPAQPTDLGVAGYNLVAARPIPNGVYSITLDFAKKAPTLVGDADQVQLGREQITMLLSYAEHLAAFKMGGADFASTQSKADAFLTQCMSYNDRLAAAARYITPSKKQSSREEKVRRRSNG